MIKTFGEQLREKEEIEIKTKYNAGVVKVNNENFIIAYEMQGARDTFSVGQPVYDKEGHIMGWLGIGLFDNLNYCEYPEPHKVRIPVEYWQICLPTEYCEEGKTIYTYWQNKVNNAISIKVGDEVEDGVGTAIVTCINEDGTYEGIDSNGSIIRIAKVAKRTGKHFDAIAEILKQMKGDNDNHEADN